MESSTACTVRNENDEKFRLQSVKSVNSSADRIAKSPQTIHAIWHKLLNERAQSPALWDCNDSARIPLKTFGQIEIEAQRLADAWRILPEGAVLAVFLGNHHSWPAVVLAALRLRLVLLPLASGMERVQRESILQTAQASALVEAGASDLHIQMLPQQRPPTFEPFAERPALLKLTSGTTGTPRMIGFSESQLVADCTQICSTMGLRETDLNFGVISISHSYGFSNLLTPLLCCGIPLILSSDPYPRAILKALQQSEATVFPTVPALLRKLVALPDAPAIPTLRLCISAGALLPPADAWAFTDQFGIKVHSFYGSSECGGIAYDRSNDPVYEEGLVGPPMDGVRIERLDGSDHAGGIAVRSAAVGLGYWPESDPAVLDGERFIPTDLVADTPRGMALRGRTSDVINIGGQKLHPGAIERLLKGQSPVRDAIVFGTTCPLRGEQCVACVIADSHPSDDPLEVRLRKICAENLAPWQVPKHFWFLPELPTNARGKVSRRDLAQMWLLQSAKPAPECSTQALAES